MDGMNGQVRFSGDAIKNGLRGGYVLTFYQKPGGGYGNLFADAIASVDEIYKNRDMDVKSEAASFIGVNKDKIDGFIPRLDSYLSRKNPQITIDDVIGIMTGHIAYEAPVETTKPAMAEY